MSSVEPSWAPSFGFSNALAWVLPRDLVVSELGSSANWGLVSVTEEFTWCQPGVLWVCGFPHGPFLGSRGVREHSGFWTGSGHLWDLFPGGLGMTIAMWSVMSLKNVTGCHLEEGAVCTSSRIRPNSCTWWSVNLVMRKMFGVWSDLPEGCLYSKSISGRPGWGRSPRQGRVPVPFSLAHC